MQEAILSDNVTDIGAYAFGYCKNLSEVRIGKEIQQLMDGTFVGTSIEKIYLPYSLVQINSKVFSDCAQLTDIYVPYGITSIADDAFNQEALNFHCHPESYASQYAELKKI